MQELITAVLAADSRALASEEDACALLVRLRWPDGALRCPACRSDVCIRSLAHVLCNDGHLSTILSGTPLGSLRKPRVRAILLGVRAMARTRRSISARELARDVGMPHNTLWRHLMRLRAMMPRHRITSLPTAAASTTTSRARILVQSMRTWLNGTFHGVARGWLHRYLQEIAARWCCGADAIAEGLVEQLTHGGPELWFERDVRPARGLRLRPSR